ncbi:MAG: Dipeptidyl-peptidase 6 [Pedosphaera sp.]|nr:Dipeptidyl-peptidase 6 [Pedosphaera sp.]
MKRNWFALLVIVALAGMLPACTHLNSGTRSSDAPQSGTVLRAIQGVKDQSAPDSHVVIFTVGVQQEGRNLVLTGAVDRAEVKAEILKAVERTGLKAADRITLPPAEELEDEVWGIASLSVANGREKPEHSAEMGTQILLGQVVKVWNRAGRWFLVQSADGYLAWLEKGTFVPCTKEQVQVWNNASLLFVTVYEDLILERPEAGAQPVSDVVMGDLVKKNSEAGNWFAVELPDGRTGFLPKPSAENYVAWKQARRATPENIERTARMFLGRPYLWGGNSPKGMDCSGFTKLTFLLNGIDLDRNASEQARQGMEVPLDPDLRELKKGDLLFFGARSRGDKPEKVSHVAIYLGEKLFIQSSERVRVNSLDPNSPIADHHFIQTLLHARRVLPGL